MVNTTSIKDINQSDNNEIKLNINNTTIDTNNTNSNTATNDDATNDTINTTSTTDLNTNANNNKKSISNIKLSPNNQLISIAHGNGNLSIYKLIDMINNLDSEYIDLNLYKPLHTFNEHEYGINECSWSKDGRYICSASDDKFINVYDVESGQLLRQLRGTQVHRNYAFSVDFNSSNSLIASGSFDETIKLWDVREPKCMRTIPGHSDAVTTVRFSSDSSLLLSSSLDGICRVWDVGLCQPVKSIYSEGNVPIYHAQFSPNDRYALISTFDSTIRLYDWQYGKYFILIY